MIKILLDQGLPRSLSLLLFQEGIDAVHVGERGASQAKDKEIIILARQEKRIIVTMDADFHTILAISAASSPSVIRIRKEKLKAPELQQLLLHVLDRCGEDLAVGAAVTVDETRIRVRRFPLIE